MDGHPWPTREEWALEYALPEGYLDEIRCALPVSRVASADEIALVKAELEEAWDRYWDEMKAVASSRRRRLRTLRLRIKSAIQHLDADRLPINWMGASPTLEEIERRWDAAYTRAVIEYRRAWGAEHPTDDAAWLKELERRHRRITAESGTAPEAA